MRKPDIAFIGLTLLHLCACSKPGHAFQSSYFVLVVVLLCSMRMKREVIIRLVEIGGIVDHRCLNSLFIAYA
jgi:hypothetical protein